jgi:hypothetical protein
MWQGMAMLRSIMVGVVGCVVIVAVGWQGVPVLADDAPAAATDATGQITGQLTDTRGRAIKAGTVAVFLLDADSGMPIHSENKLPIDPSFPDPQLDKLWVVETGKESWFLFNGVRPGRYRVVAQSWSGTEGFLGFGNKTDPSAFLILHGVADNVEVKAGEQATAMVRQLGNHVLRIVNDPEEEHALLLVSLKPTLGDGILGPIGWGKEFRRNWIGVTQMEVPHVTIVGLPDDAPIHVGLMNYDNNPGVGAASYAAGQRDGRLRIVASWSNGHKDPPAELVELTDHLEKQQIDLQQLLKAAKIEPIDGQDARAALVALLTRENDRVIAIAGLGEKRLADVLAAYGYVQLQKSKG